MATIFNHRPRIIFSLHITPLHGNNRWNNDRLTELTNRHGFTEQAKHLTLMARRAHQQIALAIISVDHLKVLNETLSTESGDTLLRTFSQRLLNSVRETDIVGRLAGNQFVILLVNIDGRDAVDQVITKLRKRLAAPLTIDNHEIFITASIGLRYCCAGVTQPLVKSPQVILFRWLRNRVLLVI